MELLSSINSIIRYFCKSGTALGNGGFRSRKWRLAWLLAALIWPVHRHHHIKARFPRRPTLRPPSSLFPQHCASSSLDAWAASVRHFFPPWQSCSRCTARLSPIFLPFIDHRQRRYAIICPLAVPICTSPL